MKLTDIIRRPLITEKTTLLREAGGTLVFEVAVGATKIDVKHDDAFMLTARNIAGIRLVPSARVTARDVMDTDHVVATREALEKLQESLA
jgi:ribosomal protein L23